MFDPVRLQNPSWSAHRSWEELQCILGNHLSLFWSRGLDLWPAHCTVWPSGWPVQNRFMGSGNRKRSHQGPAAPWEPDPTGTMTGCEPSSMTRTDQSELLTWSLCSYWGPVQNVQFIKCVCGGVGDLGTWTLQGDLDPPPLGGSVLINTKLQKL